MPAGSGFFAELKRRHVWRVAFAYAVTGWLIVQIATQVFPIFHMPDWTAQFVVILVVIGFPIGIVLAWAFELTPDGVRRTEPPHSPEARDERETRAIARRFNTVIIAVLVIAVALLGWRLLAVQHGETPAEKTGVASPSGAVAAKPPVAATSVVVRPIPPKSIAVLPFDNLSNDKNNEYFVAGMEDLILTKLAGIGDLKVISRTSTEKYKSHPDDLKGISRQLGVATFLEGSVQKQGNEVLINVQLIDASSESHIWAQSYTRTLDNIFGVEGEVAEKISAALNTKLSPGESASLAAVPTTNPTALDLYLRAEFQATRAEVDYDTAGWKAAISLYRQAVASDPGFALAWARLSYGEIKLAWYGGGGEDVKQLTERARADAQRALQLKPDLAASQLAIGYSDYYGRSDYAAALKAFDAALALQPNNANALAARGYVERRQGLFDDAIVSLQQALVHDPRNGAFANDIGTTCMMASRYVEAETWFRLAQELDPKSGNAKANYSTAILLGTGDVARALAASDGDSLLLKSQRVALLTAQHKYGEAIALLESIQDTPDNFSVFGGSKALSLAYLYQLAGEKAKARSLFEQALPLARAQLGDKQGFALAVAWQNVAYAELGLGHTATGLEAVGKAQAIVAQEADRVYGSVLMELNASLYAEARRPDLAIPLLTQALATQGIGYNYSPVLLWLDPVWYPIRHDPGFQALLKQYAKYKPAVIYDTASATTSSSAR